MTKIILTSLFSLIPATAQASLPSGAAAASAPSSISPASALPAAPEEEMKELKGRFEDRYPKIRELKQAGVVGETSEGDVDFVKDRPADSVELIQQENADRHRLYDLLGEKEGVSPVTVAKRNAARNFEKAKKGEYLKREGKWTQK